MSMSKSVTIRRMNLCLGSFQFVLFFDEIGITGESCLLRVVGVKFSELSDDAEGVSGVQRVVFGVVGEQREHLSEQLG